MYKNKQNHEKTEIDFNFNLRKELAYNLYALIAFTHLIKQLL